MPGSLGALCAVPEIVHALCLGDPRTASALSRVSRVFRAAMSGYDLPVERCAPLSRMSRTELDRVMAGELYAAIAGLGAPLSVHVDVPLVLRSFDGSHGVFSKHRYQLTARRGGWFDLAWRGIESDQVTAVANVDAVVACLRARHPTATGGALFALHPELVDRVLTRRAHAGAWRSAGGQTHAVTFAALRYFDDPCDAVRWCIDYRRDTAATRPVVAPEELSITDEDLARYTRHVVRRLVDELPVGGRGRVQFSAQPFDECNVEDYVVVGATRQTERRATASIMMHMERWHWVRIATAFVDNGRIGKTAGRRALLRMMRRPEADDVDHRAARGLNVHVDGGRAGAGAHLIDATLVTAMYMARKRPPALASLVDALLRYLAAQEPAAVALSHAWLYLESLCDWPRPKTASIVIDRSAVAY